MHNTPLNPRICIGTGLIALDVIISANQKKASGFFAGGSCGNVLTILSYLGWNSYPIARLSNNVAGEVLLEDLQKWNVKDNLLTFTEDGSTPVIIHRIMKDNHGAPKHRFEFRNPEDGSYLPSYKPCLAKSVEGIVSEGPTPSVYYFDRINRGSIDLAKAYKKQGALIFFEPSSMKDFKGFNECIELADIVKFSNDRITGYSEHYPVGEAPLEIETLGNQGLQYRVKGNSIWETLAGYNIDNVIDSAGAGDWCTAGIIMSLVEKDKTLELTKENIGIALRFGQALSALNCTFEGARGLMYHINKRDLLLSVHHIIAAELKKIPQRSTLNTNYLNPKNPLDISSLFQAL